MPLGQNMRLAVKAKTSMLLRASLKMHFSRDCSVSSVLKSSCTLSTLRFSARCFLALTKKLLFLEMPLSCFMIIVITCLVLPWLKPLLHHALEFIYIFYVFAHQVEHALKPWCYPSRTRIFIKPLETRYAI